MTRTRNFAFLTLVSLIITCKIATAQCAQEQYFMTQDVHPSGAEPYWHEGNDEVQGVANDGSSWFITTTEKAGPFSGEDVDGSIWRIPIGAFFTESYPGVIERKMSDVEILNQNNFVHFGDPDHFRYGNVDYILVPAYDNDDPNHGGAIICFRADDLEYINYGELNKAPLFCFFDRDSALYIHHSTDELRKYFVNWERLTNPSYNDHSAIIEYSCRIQLDLSQAPFSAIENWQGGEFGASDDWLYISSGKAGVGESRPSDGLHVFKVNSTECFSTWQWIKTSSNSASPNEPFTFLFFNDAQGQQPQGLTYWDIDNEDIDDEIRGKIHVMMFEWTFAGDNRVFMYHFSENIFVDSQNGLTSPTRRIGSIEKPFKYFNDAFYHYPAWNGSTIVLKSGNYNETGTYNQCVKITSEGGPAIIGQ